MELRLGGAGDASFLAELFVATKRWEFEALGWPDDALSQFLLHQFEIREMAYSRSYPMATNVIAELDSSPIGRLLTNVADRSLNIVDVAVLPGRQNQGIGTCLLSHAIERARTDDLEVELHVEVRNVDARRLYERLGFVATDHDEMYCRMRRTSPAMVSP